MINKIITLEIMTCVSFSYVLTVFFFGRVREYRNRLQWLLSQVVLADSLAIFKVFVVTILLYCLEIEILSCARRDVVMNPCWDVC